MLVPGFKAILAKWLWKHWKQGGDTVVWWLTDWLLISLLQVRQTRLKNGWMDCTRPLHCCLPTPAWKYDGRRFMEPWLWLTCLRVVPTLTEVCVSLCVRWKGFDVWHVSQTFRSWWMEHFSSSSSLQLRSMRNDTPVSCCLMNIDRRSVCDLCVWVRATHMRQETWCYDRQKRFFVFSFASS